MRDLDVAVEGVGRLVATAHEHPRPDAEVVAVAAAEERVIVTENVKDFAGVQGVTVLCVLKSRLPPQGMHVHLAELLDQWALAHPEPYRGLHWP